MDIAGGKMSIEISEQLLNSIKGNYDGFNARFQEVTYNWVEKDITVSGNFFYPSFLINGQPSIPEMVDYLYHRIIPFCIPEIERQKADIKYNETKDYRYSMELCDQAKNLFVQARKSQKTSGEPAELLLFILLEAVLKAPQIACKMYLKTNRNVPVHGTDSIHARIGTLGNNLLIIWGESKMYQELDAALDKICESLLSFITKTQGHAPRDRDIEIMKSNLNITDPKLQKAILDHFDPYSEKSNKREEMFACLVLYDGPIYKNVSGKTIDELENNFKAQYGQTIEEACKLFGTKLRDSDLCHCRIHFFLIPVPQVAEVRKIFFERLGVNDD
jgi:hypothetical protein